MSVLLVEPPDDGLLTALHLYGHLHVQKLDIFNLNPVLGHSLEYHDGGLKQTRRAARLSYWTDDCVFHVR